MHAGVTLLTLSGRTMVSRMGASIISLNKGYHQIAKIFIEYKKAAINLSKITFNNEKKSANFTLSNQITRVVENFTMKGKIKNA